MLQAWLRMTIYIYGEFILSAYGDHRILATLSFLKAPSLI